MPTIKEYAFAAMTAMAPSNPHSSGNLGKALSAVRDFVADIGVSESVKRQLVGIEQIINKQLVNLGPHQARTQLKQMSVHSISAQADCSVYDAEPSAEMSARSGALVFVKYYSDAYGVVHDPIVELVGFGSNMESAMRAARHVPNVSAVGVGRVQNEKSYMLWYQFKYGKIEAAKIPYPFYVPYLSVQ